MTEAMATAPSRRFARELTSLVASPFIIWAIGWADAWVWIVTVSLVAVVALWEFLLIAERKGYPIQKPLALALMLVILATLVSSTVSVQLGIVAVLLAVPASYVFARCDLDSALPASGVTVLAILYLGLLGGSLIRLRTDFDGWGPKLLFFLLIVVWTGDSGAYYVGRRFGRHKLCPRVSPKKTVEGAVGGVAISLLSAMVVHYTFFTAFPLAHVLICALLVTLAGILGDLVESAWKRSAAVKDSGGLLPGHGGFLDRIDSILFAAPILYGYWFLIDKQFRLITP